MTQATKVVRNLMQAHGKASVYTNKNKTFRSVKCYGNPENNKPMLDSIKVTLFALNVPFSLNFTTNSGAYNGGPGIIVRLPL